MRAVGLAAGMLLAVLPTAAMAETLTVTRTDDPDGSSGACLDGGACSLRQAVNASNATPGPDLITLPPGTFVRNSRLGGDLTVTGPVTIAGAGARATVIDATGNGNAATQGLTLTGPGDMEVRDLTVTGGHGSLEGGGIDAGPAAVLTLRRVMVRGNQAYTPGVPSDEAKGGGVFSAGVLTVIDSTVSGNRAEGANSLVVGKGGGIYARGVLAMVNSTVTGNFAHAAGGVYLDSAQATLNHVTLAGNTSSDDGLGGNMLLVGAGVDATLTGSILSGGDALPSIMDCWGGASVTSLGGNVGTGIGCALGPGDRAGVDPQLGPLADNGGPTDTMAIGPGSPAVDFAGPCALPADQRGVPRYGACDSGAVEVPTPAPPIAPAVLTPLGRAAPVSGAPGVVRLAGAAAPGARPRCAVSGGGDTAALRVTVRCTRAVSATLRGTVALVPEATLVSAAAPRAAPRRAELRPVKATFRAGKTTTLRLAVPGTVSAAVRRGARASVTLRLVDGVGRVGAAAVPRLRPAVRTAAAKAR